MACNCACSDVKTAAKLELQPVDLLRLFLDVNDQLVAVLLLNLLVAELFGLAHGAVRCRSLISFPDGGDDTKVSELSGPREPNLDNFRP